MQATVNMQRENIDNWLVGRRIFHSSTVDGTHFDPSNGSNGNNPALAAVAHGASAFDDRCSDCHLDNGVNPDRANASNGNQLGQSNGYITPRLVGMGILEAIPNAQIEAWAAEDHSDEGVQGTISNVNGYIGRFGWQASQPSVREQVIAAAQNEQGMTAYTNQEIDQMTTYIQLLAVPAARAEDLNTHPGYNAFTQFGCDTCHKPNATTGGHPLAELRNQQVRPFTDLLLHDLGDSDGAFRTAPLMGLGLTSKVFSVAKDAHDGTLNGCSGNVQCNAANATTDLANENDNEFVLMHDGHCTGDATTAFNCAIDAHGGEGDYARQNYTTADPGQRNALIQFLQAL